MPIRPRSSSLRTRSDERTASARSIDTEAHSKLIVMLPFTTDIYIACISAAQNVCPQNLFIAIVSTIVETSVPERELLPGLQLLGTIQEK